VIFRLQVWMPEVLSDKEPLVIWGASGHARVVTDAVLLADFYEIIGFLDDDSLPGSNATFESYPILGGRDHLSTLGHSGGVKLIFGFSDCQAKLRLSALVSGAGIEFATVTHPHAVLARQAAIGAGTFIAAGAVINSGTRVGRHVIINTSASVDHDCIIGDAAHICPGVRLAGNVAVGNGAWVGIGTTVIEKRSIGAGSVIGAGSLVIDDIPPQVLAFGQPARVVRRLE
jgi:acetyltransferase EpsM